MDMNYASAKDATPIQSGTLRSVASKLTGLEAVLEKIATLAETTVNRLAGPHPEPTGAGKLQAVASGIVSEMESTVDRCDATAAAALDALDRISRITTA